MGVSSPTLQIHRRTRGGYKIDSSRWFKPRPFDSLIDLEVDEELQEDNFIAQINQDIFQPVANDKPRPIPRKNSQLVSSISDNDDGTVSRTSSDDVTAGFSQPSKPDDTKNGVIDLWSTQGTPFTQITIRKQRLKADYRLVERRTFARHRQRREACNFRGGKLPNR